MEKLQNVEDLVLHLQRKELANKVQAYSDYVTENSNCKSFLEFCDEDSNLEVKRIDYDKLKHQIELQTGESRLISTMITDDVLEIIDSGEASCEYLNGAITDSAFKNKYWNK